MNFQPLWNDWVWFTVDFNDPKPKGLGRYATTGWERIRVGDRVKLECCCTMCEATVIKVRPCLSVMNDRLFYFETDPSTFEAKIVPFEWLHLKNEPLDSLITTR